MPDIDIDTLVIGAGFAGLSVAQALPPADTLVLDRGEPFDPVSAAARLVTRTNKVAAPELGHLDQRLDETAVLFQSELPGNNVSFPLSLLSGNSMSYRIGGTSNWWGGYAARIPETTFGQDGVLSWPLDAAMLAPWYAEAERVLRVHGDPTVKDHTVAGALPGWDYWREYFAPLFPLARVAPQAKNASDTGAYAMGRCRGFGHCAVCPQDAKARPATVFPTVNVHGATRAERIVFRGSRAVGIECESAGERMRISFERLVVAAGGLENVALLRRSLLPVDTPRTFGHHYQDHTACEVLAYLPAPFRRFHLGAEGGIELPELSGDFAGLGVRTLMLPVELTHEQLALLADGGKYPDAREVECLARFYLQIEVPPEWGLALRSRGWQSYLHTMPYLAHLPQMDAASLLVVRRMESAGIRIARVQPHYRSGFGGHHFAGTTPMSRTAAAVVGPDSRLIGTENVYLNGASVLPRCGYSGPTLTIVALGLRLGARLAGRPTDKPAPAA